MAIWIKQHLSSIQEKLNITEAEFKKTVIEKACICNQTISPTYYFYMYREEAWSFSPRKSKIIWKVF